MILTYKGIKINYHTAGQGHPVVFLHGFLENATMWKEMIPFFSNKYHCISIDLLGHGETGSLGYIHTMEDMALAVKAALDHLEIAKAILIGHSMGGYVSLALTDLFSDLITGLVLLNSTSFPDNEERKLNRTRAIDIVKQNPNAYTSMAIANLFAEKNRLKYSEEIIAIKKEASKTSLQGIISALEGMKIRKDRTSVLSSFTGPKVIFSGKEDPVLTHDQNVIESKQSSTNLISFDGGHMTYIENKENLVLALQKFLQKF
ncbi:alpha/beta hydrolase [Aquimarina gracilis]|uniref:Alpha/beta hydrolase n=1 Tax=Aquimarina gracilis TaxID=874422 RepID=A0ABU6A142_9FLAO|nr:alpha/beta hydrolase [Aquimarina gracilis]MEB3347839.1 alpha/beta hydrolase [Aquimarina gracilis]